VILLDVNVWVRAFRPDLADHDALRDHVDELLGSPLLLAVPDSVMVAFVRITTNPRIFPAPTPVVEAFAAVEAIRAVESTVTIAPGPRHWELLSDLCRDGQARGDLVADAHLAALAIEHGCELLTLDRDFARFPGVRTRSPLD
jgi:hypothetical protein